MRSLSLLTQANPSCGKDGYPLPRRIIWGFILILFVIVDFQALAILGNFSAVAAVDAGVAILVLESLMILWWFRGIRFYITSRRIVKTRDFYRWSKTWELPLEFLTDILSKRIGPNGYVVFVPSPGHSQIQFGPIKDDPEEVRQIATWTRSRAQADRDG